MSEFASPVAGAQTLCAGGRLFARLSWESGAAWTSCRRRTVRHVTHLLRAPPLADLPAGGVSLGHGVVVPSGVLNSAAPLWWVRLESLIGSRCVIRRAACEKTQGRRMCDAVSTSSDYGVY